MANFEAVAQSSTKIRLTFSTEMTIDGDFIDTGNYAVVGLNGTAVGIASVSVILDGTNQRGEIILSDSLDPLGYYRVTIASAVTTSGGQPLSQPTALFQWKTHLPAPIAIPFRHFSGEVSGGLLGDPEGQVFFSPAYGTAVADSILQVDQVDVCTRAYDVYKTPQDHPTSPILYTYVAPDTASVGHTIGAQGAVLFAPAPRLGLAKVVISDLREDAVDVPEDGPADATLVETIDITSGGFLNDVRWETFPATTASVGAFTTAANTAPIGPGPTTNINLQP